MRYLLYFEKNPQEALVALFFICRTWIWLRLRLSSHFIFSLYFQWYVLWCGLLFNFSTKGHDTYISILRERQNRRRWRLFRSERTTDRHPRSLVFVTLLRLRGNARTFRNVNTYPDNCTLYSV